MSSAARRLMSFEVNAVIASGMSAYRKWTSKKRNICPAGSRPTIRMRGLSSI
jgi:hypothetical protein